MTKKHVLFDLDGTLTDPSEGIYKCIAHALTQMKMPVPPVEELDWVIGPPLTESFGLLLRRSNPALIAQAITHYRERFAESGLYENRLYEGVESMLETVGAAGWKIHLATSKPVVYATKILAHFGIAGFFSGVYGAELDGKNANKKDLIAHLLADIQVPPEEVVMIGDRMHDVVGAKENGVKTIAVTYGFGKLDELTLAEPYAMVENLADIPAMLESLKK